LLIRDHVGNRHFEAENRYAHVCLLYHGLPGSPARSPAPERFGVEFLSSC
jgi:hypothetical protein